METRGIYQIRNILNNYIYIGSTTRSFREREYEHFYFLERDSHANKHLQSAYNKYGRNNFVFEALEECLPNETASLETYWITLLNPEYNILPTSFNSLGFRHSKETKEIISNKNKGRTPSEETRIKMRESHKGLKRTEESKLKSSESAKKRWAKTKKQKYIKKRIAQIDPITNEVVAIYKSCAEVERATGIAHGNISAMCRDKIITQSKTGYKYKYKTLGGYIWKYL